MTDGYHSWGMQHAEAPARAQQPQSAQDISWNDTMLAYGCGRSYGDSCLNSAHTIVDMRGMNHYLAFDQSAGTLRCEAGLSFETILQDFVPRGWFLPVTPGTKFVTVGGAIANDVHGKNHHRAGSFGHHITKLALLRSDGTVYECSPEQHAELFRATIGGLGLTGIILWAEFCLIPISSPLLEVTTTPFDNVEAFFTLSAEAKEREYTVAWVDCSPSRKHGRGLFIAGDHCRADHREQLHAQNVRGIPVPCMLPEWLLNRGTMQLFNSAFFHKQKVLKSQTQSHYDPFFYPLDHVQHWNRIYGKRGLLQYQCVVPLEDGPTHIRTLLDIVGQSGHASFLSVLKIFGAQTNVGMMSFPRPGVTLAMDFPHDGTKTLALLSSLDEVVMQIGGCVYPAKDARMSPAAFRQYFPQWETFQQHCDPQCSSNFWRRVTQEAS